jgi:hypothetical protein
MIEIFRLPFVVVETSRTAYSIGNWKVKCLLNSQKWLEGNMPPPTLTISSNTPNQTFETAILWNVIERFGNSIFEDDNPRPLTHSPQGEDCKLCSVGIKDIYRKDYRKNFGGGLIGFVIWSSRALLRIQSDLMVDSPLHLVFSWNISDRNSNECALSVSYTYADIYSLNA